MLHEFEPSRYHSTLGPHEPVLRVADGDTITTTTVDAHGVDSEGQRVHHGANGQTGPFYVEGAEPGDALAVHLDRIQPNRDHGYTCTTVAPNVVEPDHAGSLPQSNVMTWSIDREGGMARLEHKLAGMAPLEAELAPMLGCFGLAPADGEAISTATSGPHGGNMDYNGFVTGVTAYFPVFAEGALLHVGDGHAQQGDGEILGTGIEISMDVTVTVRLLKGKRIGWPRGENNEHIFTVGNARPLDQALQHATTEMLRWLETDFGLDAAAASLLLGTYVHYDVGNVFDPAYTMVCRLPKRVLPNR